MYTKNCPFTAASDYSSKCDGELCAFWVVDQFGEGCCAVVEIAAKLSEIAAELRGDE